MAVYRIHRLRESVRQQFRWAPHTAGITTVRPKDYEGTTTVEATTCYAAWTALRGTEEALQPGDVLEAETGELRILKYIGFEEAQWHVPETKPAPETAAPAVQS
jgi:hypothetical protein